MNGLRPIVVALGSSFLAAGISAVLASPPLNGTPSWTFETNHNTSWFGYSIASAGDVNGDGYDDVIVGAPMDTGPGAAFVFHGSATGLNPTTWQWMASGDTTNSRFGWSVAGAGDVNGDGYDDVVVGAPGANLNAGGVYLYLGSASGLQASPAWRTVEGIGPLSWIASEVGFAVAGAGDVNGDGYADVVVGAPFLYREANNSSGAVFLWLGGPGDLGPDGTPQNADWWVRGQQNGDQFGLSVAAAGDVNGDGRGDLIVGAPGYGDPRAGRVYVFLTENPPTSDLLFPHVNQDSDLSMGWCALPVAAPSQGYPGFSVTGAGDLNGDGKDDVAIGLVASYLAPDPEVEVWFGRPGGLPYQWTANGDVTLSAPIEQGLVDFGTALTGAGDVDGDGHDDLVVSAAHAAAAGTVDGGRVYMFRGVASGIEATPAWTSPLLSEEAMSVPYGQTRLSVAGRSDVDGDAFADVLAGLPYYSTASHSHEGRSLLWRGCPDRRIYFRDTDADGRGDPGSSTHTCDGSIPAGYVANSTDCDDGRASVYPGAPQLCDGLANDCDDATWPAPPANEADRDGDGSRACSGECNDASPGTHPGATELCDGTDDDCDGIVDEGCDTSCDSPEKAATEVNLTPGAFAAVSGRLAWNGNGYGLVWSDQRDGNAEIYFARFDASMSKIGADVRVTNAAGVSDNPWIVWTGTHYGLAWEDVLGGYPAIFFVRVDAAGNELGAERAVVAVESGTVRTPRLLWTGSEYGLFWNDNRSGYWQNVFRTIDVDGIALGTSRAVNAAGYDAGPCQVAWNGTGYMVTNNRLGDTEIYVVRLDAQGAALAPEQRVTYFAGNSRSPTVVWRGDEYGLFWIDNHYGPQEIFYARLALDGTKIGGDVRLMPVTGILPLYGVAWTGSEYGLAWVDTKNGNSEIYVERIDTTGAAVSSEVRVTSDPALSQTPSLQWTGSAFGLAFIDGRPGTNSVFGARIACCDDADADGFNECHECDDAHASAYPGAPQLCDGLNNDCSDPSWPDLPESEADWDGDGWRVCAGDCNDLNAWTYPVAPEINDGEDNQCTGDAGHGLIDEIDGGSGFTNAGDRNSLCWTAQAGAAEYLVARSTDAAFQGGCAWHVVSGGACWSDSASPSAGQSYYYLVRANGPYVGSWGSRSSGVERSGACLAETACGNGSDDDGDLTTDCQDPDCAYAAECNHVFTFTDTSGADITSDALFQFFAGFTVDPSAYLLFRIDQPNLGRTNAWCSARADFYRDGYLAHATSGSFLNTGGWPIWWNAAAPQASWSGPSSGAYPNGFGAACAGRPYAWCSMSGLGGLPSRVVDPTAGGNCQVYDAGAGGCGDGSWSLTIRVAPTRRAACGF